LGVDTDVDALTKRFDAVDINAGDQKSILDAAAAYLKENAKIAAETVEQIVQQGPSLLEQILPSLGIRSTPAPIEINGEGGSVDASAKDGAKDEQTSKTVVIDDVQAFKAGLPLSAAPKPVKDLSNASSLAWVKREVERFPLTQRQALVVRSRSTSHRQTALGAAIRISTTTMLQYSTRRLLPAFTRRSAAIRAYTTSSHSTDNPVPANDPNPKQPHTPVSSTNQLPTSSAGTHDQVLQESTEDAEQKRVMQAPNRETVWSRSQKPRSEAMVGPRFEQTIM
ncbi:hypothetical protein KC331_g21316, partial [Hortaea werneckii]